jgi:hypothetical protein
MDARGQTTRIARFISASRSRLLLALAALGLAGSVLTLVAVQSTNTKSVPAVGLAAEAAAARQAAPAVPAVAAPAAVGASDSGMSDMPGMGSSSTPSSPTSSASASPSPAAGAVSSSGDCASKEMLTQLYQHLESAHLSESPGQQVADALSLDQWIKTHTVWLDNMIVHPAEGGSATLSAVLEPFVQHVEAAHLGESLGQQVADALNLDQWIKVHTVLVETMLKPLFAQTTC